MIILGTPFNAKVKRIQDHVADTGAKRVVVLSPSKFQMDMPEEWDVVEWSDIIMYRTFYRLLQEIDPATLLVINECLRVSNRSDLTYNCIRHFAAQTRNVLVFQYLPIIDDLADFMTLVDFVTGSRFKGLPWSSEVAKAVTITGREVPVQFREIRVEASQKTRATYQRERDRAFEQLGAKDPHTIPRNLYQITGRDRLAATTDRDLVGRNNRFKISRMQLFRDRSFRTPSTIFEVSHSIRDVVDFLSLSEQEDIPFIATDVKVDQWYYQQTRAWEGRLREAYAAIRSANRPGSFYPEDIAAV